MLKGQQSTGKLSKMKAYEAKIHTPPPSLGTLPQKISPSETNY